MPQSKPANARRDSTTCVASDIGYSLKATGGVTIALVPSRERKRRQPGHATDDPAFVGCHQLGHPGILVHFDFTGGTCENGRAAADRNRASV
jgi:hypothetical protein